MAEDKFNDLEYQKRRFQEAVGFFDTENQEKIFAALRLAHREHQGQKRSEGTSYIIHPLRAALVLLDKAEIKDADLACACLLHDVVEDGEATIKQIERNFGGQVARLVSGVTRPRPENETKEEKQKSKLAKIEGLKSKDKKIRLVALADVVDNARSQHYIPKDSPARKKLSRWQDEFKKYLEIAKNTDKTLYKLLKDNIIKENNEKG